MIELTTTHKKILAKMGEGIELIEKYERRNSGPPTFRYYLNGREVQKQSVEALWKSELITIKDASDKRGTIWGLTEEVLYSGR
jgi:hypothetical protein